MAETAEEKLRSLIIQRGRIKAHVTRFINFVDEFDAVDLLKTRFDNKKLIKRSHVASLFNIAVLTKESHYDLRKFVDDLNKHLRALKNLGESVETWDALLIHLVSIKLDPITKREWESHSAKELDDPKVKDLTQFLSERCNILESLSSGTGKNIDKNINKTFNKKFQSEQRTVSYLNSEIKVIKCILCKGTHFLHNCQEFLKLPAKARYDEAKTLRVCTNCLRWGHFNSECRSIGCKKCHKRHNTLLHLEEPSSSSVKIDNQPIATTSAVENTQNVSINAHSANKHISQVLLSTAIIYVRDEKNNQIRCRALLDSGSQSNFMTRELFELLNVTSNIINLSVAGIGQAVTKIIHQAETIIGSLHNAYSKKLSFLILEKITERVPTSSIKMPNFGIPGNITLADPNFNIAGKIDILLGAEVFWELLCVGQINNGLGKPILQKTKLGWLVSGPISYNTLQNQTKTLCNLTCITNLENQIERFWKVEECNTEGKFSAEELQCERIFLETTIRDKSGRFIVTLPMRGSVDELGDSRQRAISRFLSMERKLENNGDLKQKYSEFINEYQIIIWRNNTNDQLQHYRLNTLTYGTSPASFLAIRCLHQLAHDNISEHPLASRAILNDFYVDDLITGADTFQKTIELKHNVETILKRGGFQLRKWVSNDQRVLSEGATSDNDISEYYISDGSNIKTLGLLWNARSDIIQVTTDIKSNDKKVTKRTILSSIAQIFDPLGLVGPIIIKAKIIMQRLWQLRIEWDESVPMDLYTEWVRFRDQITSLTTLPRLELCGALLLAQLSRKVINSLDMNITDMFYWCDSSIKYSSLTRLRNVVAYCFRFARNYAYYFRLRHKYPNELPLLTGPLTVYEITRSMNTLIKLAQAAEFSVDLKQLKHSKRVSRCSKLSSLNPFIDDEGIIRVGGRIVNSDVSVDQKHPIVLPNKHPLTRLIIAHEHEKYFHLGPQATLASIKHILCISLKAQSFKGGGMIRPFYYL
ncbi:hypothetical protein NQ317_003844 [Molorchus minor]|uniref:Peptidase aspartic putative domain-containing protein n=1 Tax=Molorchus minor TaxID=1323400 RepID=A0ABQ9IQ69_9CUCU|nr:hypothetical protein NQ317_003844 [Molorchus minor]